MAEYDGTYWFNSRVSNLSAVTVTDRKSVTRIMVEYISSNNSSVWKERTEMLYQTVHSEEGLTLETLASLPLHGGNLTLIN